MTSDTPTSALSGFTKRPDGVEFFPGAAVYPNLTGQRGVGVGSGFQISAQNHSSFVTLGNLTDPFVASSDSNSPADNSFTSEDEFDGYAEPSLSCGSDSGRPWLRDTNPVLETGDRTKVNGFLDRLTDKDLAKLPNGHALAWITPVVGGQAFLYTLVGRDGTKYDKNIKVVRALVVTFDAITVTKQLVKDYTYVKVAGAVNGPVLIDLSVPGELHLGFSDVRDCEAVMHMTHTLGFDWKLDYTSPIHLSMKLGSKVSTADGDDNLVYAKVRLTRLAASIDVEGLKSLVPKLLRSHGQLDFCRSLVSDERNSFCFVAGYHQPFAAKSAVLALNGHRFEDAVLSLTHLDHAHGSSKTAPTMTVDQGFDHVVSLDETDLQRGFDRLTIGPAASTTPFTQQIPPSYPFGRVLSSTGRTTLASTSHPNRFGAPHGYNLQTPATPFPANGGYSLYPGHNYQVTPCPRPVESREMHGAIGQERAQLGPVIGNRDQFSTPARVQSNFGHRRGHEYGAGHHNVVDISRIQQGLDVRTTIMLRNIPNKIDQPMLKQIVDETSVGKYDFMYLRIDFANNCNVGYAFINFEDPYYIIEFVKARAGYRWNRFNSDKVAEVSYATIQGKDCLVQKFRNSSVMLENPLYRPKVYHTGTGPLAGTEDVFPKPDNLSKMNRSIQNAAHVGLFSPGGGQNPRHDQRRRRSQFDRGTRLAQMEEAYGVQDLSVPRPAIFATLPRTPRGEAFGSFENPFGPSGGVNPLGQQELFTGPLPPPGPLPGYGIGPRPLGSPIRFR